MSAAWERTQTKGRSFAEGRFIYKNTEDEWRLNHRYAGASNNCNGGSRVRISKKVNGSTADAFGGARHWPYVNLEVSLPVDGGVELAEKLAAALRQFVSRFVEKNNLDAPLAPEGE